MPHDWIKNHISGWDCGNCGLWTNGDPFPGTYSRLPVSILVILEYRVTWEERSKGYTCEEMAVLRVSGS